MITEQLVGDASDRQFFRVKSKNSTYVKMQYLNKDTALIQKFVDKQKIFKACKVQVPDIYDVNFNDAFVLLDDLGSVHLADLESSKQQVVYSQIIDIILSYQSNSTYKEEQFTAETFMEELLKTYEYFVEFKCPKLKQDQKFRDDFVINAKKLVLKQSKQLVKFVHRDLHSRNIMIKNDAIFLIDFQDAKLGPYAYDVASIFVDPYNDFTKDKDILSEDFLPYIENYANKIQVPLKKFINEYKLNAMQRLLKMLGTFVYLYKEKNMPKYLNYIPSTMKKISFLGKDFPEWKEFISRCQ